MATTKLGRVKFVSHVAEVETATELQVARALEELGLRAEEFSKIIITRKKAVDTGRLRNSITHQISPENKTMVLGTNVNYAPYVEFGTSKMPPRSFIGDSMNAVSQIAEEIVKKNLKK